ncbi:MAG: hypothetical protein CM15mP46_4180 [Alphaproteobacteria bacterium]|nr:MAG: hypothetical protein CM15mP46_4180 [Alphaproteobacteria bacterium]
MLSTLVRLFQPADAMKNASRARPKGYRPRPAPGCLINSGRIASEIVAGALKDHQRAVLLWDPVFVRAR